MNETLMLCAQIVIAGLWQGTLVAAAVALLLRILPPISAAQRFAVWLLTFAIALALPFLRLGPAVAASGAVRVAPAWGLGLAALWLVSFALRLAFLLAEALRVRAVWRSAKPVAMGFGIECLLQASPRNPGLYVSAKVTAPSVIGFFSPRLLLPTGLFEQLTEAELRQIVLHECEHLRRYDDWLNLLQKLALAVFPLNLALVWLDRRLGLERELACDAGVVARTGAPLDYASCLARLAEHRLGGHRFALALSAWARRSELARRVYTLLAPVRSVSRLGSRTALAGLTFALALSALELGRVPQVIRFAPPQLSSAVPFIAPAANASIVPVVFHPGAQKSAATLHRVSARRIAAARPAPHVYRAVSHPRRSQDGLVQVKFTYSYAAVPFGDGWLIVQL